MNRSRGLRGYHSLGCVASFPYSNRRVSERRKAVGRTGRYSDTSVLVGRKHKKTASSLKRKRSGIHIRPNTPYIHSQYNAKGIHKPHNISSKRKSSATLTYHSTVSTHTPYKIPFTHTHDYSRPIHTHTNALLTTYTQTHTHTHGKHTYTHTGQAASKGLTFTHPSQVIHTDTLRVDIRSHPHYKRKGLAKAHHKRHTHTHTRHVSSKGFAFTCPCQNMHTHTGNNKFPEPVRFIGRCNKSQNISTGVVYTNRPWFRRILAIQGDGEEGTRIEPGRYRQWAEIAEGRHRGWTNTGMIPNETPKVERYEDFLPFHDWLMQKLGEWHRYIIYRINMTSSPYPRGDLERNNWMETNYPEAIILWEKGVYQELEQALQNFKPTRYIFLQHRIGHPLCASRVWFSLLDKFQQQLEADMTRGKHRTMGEGNQDDGEPCTMEESDETSTSKTTFIHARGTQLEHVDPVHFVKSSMSPAHLQRKQSWWNMVRHAHASKMLLSRRWKYFLKRRSHRRRMDVRLRPRPEDMSPSHRSPLDRYAATPPAMWTRKPREAGVIYENETIIEKISFIIPLASFRVHSLQEHEIRVVARYDTVMTAGELTRHISAHYGTNPDLYLLVNGTPIEDSDKVSSDYSQQILLKTRLRGGMRRSSRAPARLDVTRELCIIRQGEPLDHKGLQEEDRQARIKAKLCKLRTRMWSQYHPLISEMDQLLSATGGPISEDDLKNLHHLSTDCSKRPLSQRGIFCQGGC